jgi:aspartate carbamoyltransferase regulatory subunit
MTSAKPTNNKSLTVSAIHSGTVIDHIAAGEALTIIRFLGLSMHKKTVTVGFNLPSRAMGAKDIIKVEGRELTPAEVNQLAIVAPAATVNIIRNYKLSKKFSVALPKRIERFVSCPNKNCITNHERVATLFSVEKRKAIVLTCAYCEKVFNREEITDYNL